MIMMPITFIIISLICHFFQKKEITELKHKGNGTITLGLKYMITGYVLLLICAIGTIVFYCASNIGVTIAFAALGALSFLLLLLYYGFSVTYDDKKLIFKKFFGRGKKIYYRKIIGIERGLDLYIRTSDDTVKIPGYATNVDELYALLEEKTDIEQLDDQNSVLPRVRNFRDSIYRPGELIFGMILLSGVCLAFSAMVIWAYFNGQITTSRDLGLAVTLVIVFDVSDILACFFTVFAAKRAHASKTWRKVLRYLIRDGYFKEP